VHQDPAIMICVGATKAGTSSLYGYLHAHSECHLRSIKELQYFSTLEVGDFDRQFDVLDRLKENLETRREQAVADDDLWRKNNLRRQIIDVKALREVIALGEKGLSDYLFYMLDGSEGKKLVGDISPSYALLSEERLREMSEMAPDVRFVFLMRDPVDRLWSHVRMQAHRQLQPGEEVVVKSRRIINRTMHHGKETHIPARGDYISIVEKLKRAVPEDKLFFGFTENVLSGEGLDALCGFLGIKAEHPEAPVQLHKGESIKLSNRQRDEAAEFLAPQYEFVEKTFGQLPARWEENRARRV